MVGYPRARRVGFVARGAGSGKLYRSGLCQHANQENGGWLVRANVAPIEGWQYFVDDEDVLTAYHEAGHAVIGFVLGGQIESVGLYAEADEWLPERFGDCHVNWGRVDANCDWQVQREVLTILAGPVAEMIYRGERLHPATFAPWQHDWQFAWQRSELAIRDPHLRAAFLELVIAFLHEQMNGDLCWAAVAAVSDELLAHEYLEADQLAETLSFWIRV